MTLDDETMEQLGFQQSEVHSEDYPGFKVGPPRSAYDRARSRERFKAARRIRLAQYKSAAARAERARRHAANLAERKAELGR